MKRILCALLTAAAAVALLCAFAPLEQQNSSSDLIVQSYEAAGAVSSLVINDKSASIVVQAADVDHVSAEYRYTPAYAQDLAANEPLYRFTLKDGTLTIEKTQEPENTRLLPERGVVRSCTLTVTLPKADLDRLSITTSNGGVSAEELAAQTAAFSVQNGKLTVNNGTFSALNAATQNGNLLLSGGTHGTLTATTQNGNLKASGLAAQELSASAQNGSVCLTDLSALRIDTSAENGSVKLDMVSAPAYQCFVQNGSLTGSLVGRSEEYGFALTATTHRITLLDNTDSRAEVRCNDELQLRTDSVQMITAGVQNGNISLEFLG